jgi:hypothetical protein
MWRSACRLPYARIEMHRIRRTQGTRSRCIGLESYPCTITTICTDQRREWSPRTSTWLRRSFIVECRTLHLLPERRLWQSGGNQATSTDSSSTGWLLLLARQQVPRATISGSQANMRTPQQHYYHRSHALHRNAALRTPQDCCTPSGAASHTCASNCAPCPHTMMPPPLDVTYVTVQPATHKHIPTMDAV